MNMFHRLLRREFVVLQKKYLIFVQKIHRRAKLVTSMDVIKIFAPKNDICVPFIIRRKYIATTFCQWTKQLSAVQTFSLFLSIIYQASWAHSFPQDVSDCGGVGEVGGGKVVALLRCFPMHDSVKRSGVPEADCQPSYRRRASFPLIDSGRGHTLTLSLHIKGSLREGESQWGYIT